MGGARVANVSEHGGWLTAINDPSLNNLDNDLFGMKLYYNNITGLSSTSVSGGALYNGNIAAIIWNTYNDKLRGFGFKYDGLSRLSEGNYGEGSDIESNKGAFSEFNLKYDKNGNILNLNRNFNGNSADELIYTYETQSNQIKNITDNTSGDIAGISDYVLRSSSSYLYDNNGNMTFDPGKNTTIKYNFLNLPECIMFSNGGRIFYHYDASGNKLAQTIESSSNSVDKTTEYLGTFVYEDDQISFLNTQEGRAVKGNNKWNYEYFLKDHLGNTRVVFSGINIPGSAEVLQTNNYYPFGLPFESKNYTGNTIHYSKNKYLYNGKEIQDDGFNGIDLDWVDYGKRFYDPQIARWHSIDPRAEKYFPYIPYNYAADDPILYIDPKGDTIIVNNTGYVIRNNKKDNLVYMQGKNGKLVSIGELGKKINANTIYKNLLDQNIKTAKGIWFPTTFKKLVQNKGEWDFKNNMKTIYGLANKFKGGETQFNFQGKWMTAEDIGNHHYGVVGKATGLFPETFMLEQAGKAQIDGGTSRPEWQSSKIEDRALVSPTGGTIMTNQEVMLPPYGDDPHDQEMIEEGFKYYDNNNK